MEKKRRVRAPVREASLGAKAAVSALIAALGVLAFASCAPDAASTREIGGWSWAVAGANDGPEAAASAKFAPVPDDALLSLEKIVPGGEGFVWLRASFLAPPKMTGDRFATYLGRLTMADRTWVNGVFVGGEGRFPPDFFSAWNVPRFYRFPSSIVVPNAYNTVLVKLYVGHEGAIAGKTIAGSADALSDYAAGETFLHVTSNLLAAGLMVVIALYHFIIFAKRRKERENLWFALLNLVGAVYLANFYFHALPGVASLGLPYLPFQQAVAATPIYLVGFMFASFSKNFLRVREVLPVLLARIVLMIAPIVLVWIAPDYRFLRDTRWIQQVFLLPPLLYVLAVTAISAVRRNRDAGVLLLGYSPIFLTTLADVVLHSSFVGLYDLPYLTGFAFPLVILSLLFILAGRFANARTEAEDLNVNLERHVAERTEELSRANGELQVALGKLETAREAAARDLKMASFVQSSYYPRVPPESGRWDVAFVFKPMADVSGDVYDFYVRRGERGATPELLGLSMFDVSGHGIASGLVAMLVKSIAARAFFEGRESPLGPVLDRVSRDLSDEKGDVENYATGVILRFGEDVVEYANGGHPDMLYRAAGGRVTAANLPDRDFKGRFLGMSEIDERRDALRFKMARGDALVVYSDGLVEAVGADGVQFGADRLVEAFARAGEGSARERLASIMAEWERFVGGSSLRDDVTVALVARL